MTTFTMGSLRKGCEYFKSLPGVLKIVEFIVLMAALGTVGYFLDKMGGEPPKKNIIKFFLAVIILAWILVMAFWLLFVSGLHERMNGFNWPIAHGIIFLLWAVLLLISSSLMADTLNYYNDRKVCELLDEIDQKQKCAHLIVGTVCGFITMVIFILDAVLHFLITNERSYTTTATSTTVTV